MLQNRINMPADTGGELMRNKASLRKVNRFFNVASIVYAGLCLVYAGVSFFMIILSVSDSFMDTFITFFDGIVIKAGVLFFGYISGYKHNNKVVWIPAALQLFDIFVIGLINAGTYFDSFFGIIGVDVNASILFVLIVLAILTVPFNKKYKYLEEQEGFPYFNERVEQDEMKRQQFETANPFDLRKKELEKNSSGDMDYLDYSLRSGDNGSGDLRGRGTMDEI